LNSGQPSQYALDSPHCVPAVLSAVAQWPCLVPRACRCPVIAPSPRLHRFSHLDSIVCALKIEARAKYSLQTYSTVQLVSPSKAKLVHMRRRPSTRRRMDPIGGGAHNFVCGMPELPGTTVHTAQSMRELRQTVHHAIECRERAPCHACKGAHTFASRGVRCLWGAVQVLTRSVQSRPRGCSVLGRPFGPCHRVCARHARRACAAEDLHGKVSFPPAPLGLRGGALLPSSRPSPCPPPIIPSPLVLRSDVLGELNRLPAARRVRVRDGEGRLLAGVPAGDGGMGGGEAGLGEGG